MSSTQSPPLRIGTRGSLLALTQAGTVRDAIIAGGTPAELVVVHTAGDTSRAPVEQIGVGVFTAALREALARGDVDVAVHSYKDLPTAAYPGLVVGATPRRADARDVLCARDGLTLGTLPDGARVGTGSPRRVAQLLKARPDLRIVDIRGNVDTRLGRVASGDLDAVVLAAAGLSRLGLLDEVEGEYLELSDWPTAPGQGSLAIEVREGRLDRALGTALAAINHATSQATTTAERFVLARLEAGCAAPIGAMAAIDDGLLFLTATVYSPDGARSIVSSHAATPDSHSVAHLVEAAQDVSERVARDLIQGGAADIAPMKVTS